MRNTAKAAVLNEFDEVVAIVLDQPLSRTIEIAGALTNTNQPVNVSTYKLSRSRKNLALAQREQVLGFKHGYYHF